MSETRCPKCGAKVRLDQNPLGWRYLVFTCGTTAYTDGRIIQTNECKLRMWKRRAERQKHFREQGLQTIRELVASGIVREKEVARLREALTPSANTKGAYSGEFGKIRTVFDDSGEDWDELEYVPWTVIKDIMAAIRKRAETKRIIEGSEVSDGTTDTQDSKRP